MSINPPVLHNGHCENLKAATHGIALATALVCATYNLAAWLVRREMHLGINAVFYFAASAWEVEHIRHHLAARCPQELVPDVRDAA
jgi:hypothetical protein